MRTLQSLRCCAVAALVLAACQGPQRTPVKRVAGIEGAWRTEEVIVETRGESALVHYADRSYEIRHFGTFFGYLEDDMVLLRGDDFEIRITEEVFQVGYKNSPPKQWETAKMPKGMLAVFDGFDLRYEAKS
jgi:hypothetical protein